MRLSIQAKLTVLLLFLLLLALVPVGWKGIDFFRSDKETSLQDLNAQTVAVQAAEIAQRLRAMQRWLALFAAGGDRGKVKSLFKLQFENHDWAGTFALLKNRLQISRVTHLGKRKNTISPKELLADKNLLAELKEIPVGGLRLFPRKTPNGSRKVLVGVRMGSNLVALTLGPPKILYKTDTVTKVYSVLIVDNKGRLILHSDTNLSNQDTSYTSLPLVKLLANPEARISGGTGNYQDPATGELVIGAYAPIGMVQAGLVVQIPKRMAFAAAEDLMKKFVFAILVIFSISVIIGIIFATSLTKPIRKLATLTKKIGEGDFNVKVEHSSRDEMGDLANAFNRMGGALKERDDLLKKAQEQLVQSEKMSAFGQMSAGIAHEVKNPLAGILGYAQLASKKASEESGLKKYLGIIEKETKRCKEIVENLMKFARQEKTEMSEVNINQVVRDSLALVDHQITISGIKIENQLAEDEALAPILASANQLQQVLANLMLNAQQAMKDSGTLTVLTRPGSNGWVEVEVADTGEGIAEENLKKIFEPFFTTKEAGKGTGLGLAVTYGIIQEHKGKVDVKSEVGKGTSFILQFPVKSKEAT